jgi:hypothetical protein
MDKLLEICDTYSRQWRYRYNANKCGVIVFNEKVSSNSTTRTFVLGKEIIKETESYTHLGLACDKYLSTKKPLTEAGNKLRESFYQ